MMTDAEWEAKLQTVRDLVAAKARLEAENAALRAALSFAASVIRSGEPWTAECERIIGGALAKP